MNSSTTGSAAQVYIDSCCQRLAGIGFTISPGPDGVTIARRRKFELTRFRVTDRIVVFGYAPAMDVIQFGLFSGWSRSLAKDVAGGTHLFGSRFSVGVAIVDEATAELVQAAQRQPSLDFGAVAMTVLHELRAGRTHFYRGMTTVGWAYARSNRDFVDRNLS